MSNLVQSTTNLSFSDVTSNRRSTSGNASMIWSSMKPLLRFFLRAGTIHKTLWWACMIWTFSPAGTRWKTRYTTTRTCTVATRFNHLGMPLLTRNMPRILTIWIAVYLFLLSLQNCWYVKIWMKILKCTLRKEVHGGMHGGMHRGHAWRACMEACMGACMEACMRGMHRGHAWRHAWRAWVWQVECFWNLWMFRTLQL